MSTTARDSLLMETTKISPWRTASEIIAKLVQIGASEINQSFDRGNVVGIKWVLVVHGEPRLFEMPVRTEGVLKILQKRRGSLANKFAEDDKLKAERVAWRQLLRWVEAQIAMIQTDMAKAEEVFLPYLYDPATGTTLFRWMDERKFPALPAASERKELPQ
jgi:hypothetical protein